MYFSNIGLPFTGETATLQAAAAASSPYTEEPGGFRGGTAYFSNIGCPFTGERQPLRPQRRPAPLAQGSQGAPAGVQCIFEYRASFHGGTATPQAAAAATPLAQGSQGEYTPAIRYKKRVSGDEPLGTLFFDLRQQLFGYCKNTSPHPRRR